MSLPTCRIVTLSTANTAHIYTDGDVLLEDARTKDAVPLSREEIGVLIAALVEREP